MIKGKDTASDAATTKQEMLQEQHYNDIAEIEFKEEDKRNLQYTNNQNSSLKDREEAETREKVWSQAERERIANFLKRILVWQLCIMLALIILQGFHLGGFKLNNYIFFTLSAGVLAQPYALIAIICKYLFPQDNKNTASDGK